MLGFIGRHQFCRKDTFHMFIEDKELKQILLFVLVWWINVDLFYSATSWDVLDMRNVKNSDLAVFPYAEISEKVRYVLTIFHRLILLPKHL